MSMQSAALNPEEALQQAVTHHQAGRFQEAEPLYRSVLRSNPSHPDANHNLGVLAVQIGQPTAALPFFNAALKGNPHSLQYWISYIDALIIAGQLQVAVQMLELGRSHGLQGEKVDALSARLNDRIRQESIPDSVPAASQANGNAKQESSKAPSGLKKKAKNATPRKENRKVPGSEVDALIILFNQGNMPEAEPLARSFTERFPEYGFGWKLLGAILRRLGRSDEALAVATRAAELLPRDAEAYGNLANVLKDQDKFAEAEKYYRRALAIKPDYAEAYNNLGTALRAENRLLEAEATLRRAVELKPDLAAAHSNLGNVQLDLGLFGDAAASFRRAVELKPDFAEAIYHLGNTLRMAAETLVPVDREAGQSRSGSDTCATLGSLDEAFACFQKALQIRPDFPDAQYGLSLLQLHMGDLENGWRGYEYRWTKTIEPGLRRPFHQPCWNGEALAGKRILVWGEQGIGDQMLWASMFEELIEQAQHVVIECAGKLVPLLSRSFPHATVVPATDPPQPVTLEAIDYQCPMGSLARFLRPTIESFPRENRYFVPDPDRVAYWKERLASLGPGPKVGFAWRSGLRVGVRNMNYTTLDDWGPIFSVPGVHFVNLQYDECTAELDAARQRFGVPLHVFPEVDLYNDLAETAAFTSAFDFVIASFTSVYPMAAGVGVQTCTMYAWSIGWATLGGKQIPWCPGLECYLREWGESWDKPVAEVAQRIRQLTQALPKLQ